MKVSDFVVGLGGEGGDELFGGYAKYVAFKKQQKMIKLLNIVPLNVFRKNIFENNNKKKYLEYRSSLYQYYLPWNTLIDHNLVKDLWTENISELIYFDQIDNFYKTLWQEVNEHDDVTNKIMKVDQLSYLPSNLNYKTDLASSANGVEIRSPYQDNRIVDYMNALPSNFKIQDKITKLILRNLLSEFFPDYDSNRTKFGFGFNRAEMIRNEYNELVNDYLSEKTIKQIGWFNHKTINKLIQLHENGKNLDNIIWPIFITTYWTKKWLKY
jgi:asparagine synthase (glutamine-hydrolysing)